MRCSRCQAENREGLRFCGKQQEAQEHLITATMMYREMEMQFWLEKAEAERKVFA